MRPLLLALVLGCSEAYEATDKSPGMPGNDTADSAEIGTDSGSSHSGGDTSGGETGVPDSDGDGWPDDQDCVANDATVYPGAPDEWYDGIDSDCAGNSDYDQDADGFLAAEIGGDDCDDRTASTYPGAADAAYDGVDADCAGNDDYDADNDGDRDPSGGGEDCDDSNANVSSRALETLDDGQDGDCNGDENGFRFYPLSTMDASGLQGPRIGADGSYLMVTFLVDSYVDDSTATTYEVGGLQHYFDQTEPSAGSLGVGSWYWGSGYLLHTGFDFAATDDHQVWAYGIQDGATRYLLVDVFDVASGIFKGTGWMYPSGKAYDDVELTEASDGSYHVVGCDDDLGLLSWMHADANAFFTNGDIVGDDASGVMTDACVADVENLEVLASNRTDGLLSRYRISDTSGLSSNGTYIGYTATDLDVVKNGTQEGWFAAEGTSGLYLELNGNATRLRAGSAQEAEVEVDALGNVYAAYLHADTGVHLAWGPVATGMPEILLETDLPRVDDVDLAVSDSGVLLVVVRGGDSAVYGTVSTP